MRSSNDDGPESEVALTAEHHRKGGNRNGNNQAAAAADAEFLEHNTNIVGTDHAQEGNIARLHRGNVLRLETETLLERVQAAETSKWLAQAMEFREKIAQQVQKVSLLEPLTPDKDSPFHFSKKAALSVQSNSPLTTREASIVGLTTTAGNANVLPTLTLHVYLPADVFAHKDYLRGRYFQKRNLVVWAVARHLMQKSLKNVVDKVYFRNEDGDVRRPALLLLPKASDGKAKKNKNGKPKYRLLIRFGCSLEWLVQPLRLVPNRCNLPDTSSSLGYNHAILSDAYLESTDDLLVEEETAEHPQWEPTVVLAKIWCLQRGIHLSTSTLGALIIFLYRSKKASPRMDPVQTLTALWKLLAQTDWLGDNATTANKEVSVKTIRTAPSQTPFGEKPSAGNREILVLPLAGKTVSLTIAASSLGNRYVQQTKESPLTKDDPKTLLELYAKQYSLAPVLLSSDLAFNILGNVSPCNILWIQRQAALSLRALHSRQSFGHLFMNTARFWDSYDAYIPIPVKAIDWTRPGLDDAATSDLGAVETATRCILEKLRHACGDRILAMNALSVCNGSVVTEKRDAIHDSDEIPTKQLAAGKRNKPFSSLSCPTTGQEDCIVVGIKLNADTCWRVVDRGPPADDLVESKKFTDLWGSRAELRRFQDGAIVHAVVWDSTLDGGENCVDEDSGKPKYSFIRFQNADKIQGETVERIVRHILAKHFFKQTEESKVSPEFSLRNLQSLVDTVIPAEPSTESVLFNPLAAHKKAMKAYDSLADVLRTHSKMTLKVEGSTDLQSRLGLPLPIDGVEPFSAALRYSEVFPPLPHPFLGSPVPPGIKKVSGAISSKPIAIQIRFTSSSNWPTDINAIGAAKTAMLTKLLEGIESMKARGVQDARFFDGPVTITPAYADVGYMGYVFRIYVRADPELRLLRGLVKPTEEALELSRLLHHRHIIEPGHHSLIHAVFTSHPSSSVATRLAKRWVASHFLSELIPNEAIELLACAVYSDETSPFGIPASATAGFFRFLRLVSTHDWTMHPLIVDPKDALSDEDHAEIASHFDQIRGKDFAGGPAMFVVAPYDRVDFDSNAIGEVRRKDGQLWSPSFTNATPETVVVARLVKLAARTLDFLTKQLKSFQQGWAGAFQESPSSFRSYSALLRIESDLLIDPEASSTGSNSLVVRPAKNGGLDSSYTRSIRRIYQGPKDLRKPAYRNLMDTGAAGSDLILEWSPVDEAVQGLRSQLQPWAVCFYNALCPEVVGILWRPGVFTPRSFSALTSEFARPIQDKDWKTDTLVAVNPKDILREISQLTSDVVVDVKVFDEGPDHGRKRKAASISDSGSGSDSDNKSQDSG